MTRLRGGPSTFAALGRDPSRRRHGGRMHAKDDGTRSNGHARSGRNRDREAPGNRPLSRDILPTPDIPPVGLTTYDAKDPDTSFPPIEPLRPPEGAPNVLIVLIDDV